MYGCDPTAARGKNVKESEEREGKLAVRLGGGARAGPQQRGWLAGWTRLGRSVAVYGSLSGLR